MSPIKRSPTDILAGCGENFLYVFKPSPARGRAGLRPDGMRVRYLPLRSRAAARLWAAGHAPARGSWATSSSGHPRWPQIVLHDREESTPLRAPIPPVGPLACLPPVRSVVG